MNSQQEQALTRFKRNVWETVEIEHYPAEDPTVRGSNMIVLLVAYEGKRYEAWELLTITPDGRIFDVDNGEITFMTMRIG